jgi:hypothetical protein
MKPPLKALLLISVLMLAANAAAAPANMHHYVIARGPTVVQVHGMGPFAISYVHSTDDPRSKSK